MTEASNVHIVYRYSVMRGVLCEGGEACEEAYLQVGDDLADSTAALQEDFRNEKGKAIYLFAQVGYLCVKAQPESPCKVERMRDEVRPLTHACFDIEVQRAEEVMRSIENR